VLKTQLYSAPNDQELREAFVTRYIRAQMPRTPSGMGTYDEGGGGKCRADYIWAITIRDDEDGGVREGGGVKLGDAAGMRLQSRIKDTKGYVGMCFLNLAIDSAVETTVIGTDCLGGGASFATSWTTRSLW
jgi:hypothetical protein